MHFVFPAYMQHANSQSRFNDPNNCELSYRPEQNQQDVTDEAEVRSLYVTS
jgi:hypothetical protein